MTYDQLVTLDSIVKQGSFKAAAESMHKSQPSLSVAIKKLEEEFQIKIFNRDNYRPVLTEAGRIFYEKAKLALAHMKSLELFGTELGMGVEREIKVGLDGLTPIGPILKSLKTFFAEFPQTNLTLDMDNISGTFHKIISNEIDLGITPLVDQHLDIESIEIAKIKMLPVATKDITKNITLDQLKTFPQIVVTDSGKKDDRSFGILEGAKKWIVSDMNSKKAIITSGLGWGRMPCWMIKESINSNLLEEITLNELEAHEIKIHLIRNKTRPMGPIAKQLWQKLSAQKLTDDY